MTTGDHSNAQRRVRHELQPEDRDMLSRLLAAVPTETRTYTLWTSRAGQQFIQLVLQLRDAGVPVRWMAEAIKVDERILTQVLHDQREREARRPRGRGGLDV